MGYGGKNGNRVFTQGGGVRTHEGWYDWPADTRWRQELGFHPDSIGHPAKANLYMLEELVKYLSIEGETILDPFGGVGSQLIGCLFGRNTILLDVEDRYHKLQLASWEELSHASDGKALFIRMDNRLVMPPHEKVPQLLTRLDLVDWWHGHLPLIRRQADHIISSPPYSNVLASPYSTLRAQAEKDDTRAEVLAGYSEQSPGNLGLLPTFQYNQQMERVYRGMAQSVRVGGTVTVLIKDFFIQGKRNYLSSWVDRTFTGMGNMVLQDWFKRKTRGLSSNDRKSRGLEAIEDEDIMVYRRES